MAVNGYGATLRGVFYTIFQENSDKLLHNDLVTHYVAFLVAKKLHCMLGGSQLQLLVNVLHQLTELQRNLVHNLTVLVSPG